MSNNESGDLKGQFSESLSKSHVSDDTQAMIDEVDCIENFKMARRCTIDLPHAFPSLTESFADFFLVGGY